MDWMIALMLVFKSLGSAADAAAAAEAQAEAEALQALIAIEASYYYDQREAELLFEEELVLIPSEAYQGDAVFVRSRSEGELEWMDRTYPLEAFAAGYYALLPIPTDLPPGTYPLGDSGAELVIHAKSFDVSRLTVTQQQADMWRDTERINADQRKINEARSQSIAEFLYTDPFLLPVEGRLTTPYGYTRYVNGVFNSIHRAVDWAAPTGTPVKASNSGVVVLADEMYLAGNSVYIDHGMNLFSQYSHLSLIHVEPGDEVEIGDIIGEVGSTGFSTGPHLHFTFWIGNTPVNPDLFIGTTPFYWGRQIEF